MVTLLTTKKSLRLMVERFNESIDLMKVMYREAEKKQDTKRLQRLRHKINMMDALVLDYTYRLNTTDYLDD